MQILRRCTHIYVRNMLYGTSLRVSSCGQRDAETVLSETRGLILYAQCKCMAGRRAPMGAMCVCVCNIIYARVCENKRVAA